MLGNITQKIDKHKMSCYITTIILQKAENQRSSK